MVFINRLSGYKVEFSASAKRDIKKIDKSIEKRIFKKLDTLTAGLQNVDVKKMEAMNCPTYRMRVGTFRVVFEVHDDKVIVLVVRVEHRKSVYRN